MADRDAPPADVHWYEPSPAVSRCTSRRCDLAEPMRALRERTPAAWIYTSATLVGGRRLRAFRAASWGWRSRARWPAEPFRLRAAGVVLSAAAACPSRMRTGYTEARDRRGVAGAGGFGRARVLAVHFASRAAPRRRVAARQIAVRRCSCRAPRRDRGCWKNFAPAATACCSARPSFWEGVDVVGEALSWWSSTSCRLPRPTIQC